MCGPFFFLNEPLLNVTRMNNLKWLFNQWTNISVKNVFELKLQGEILLLMLTVCCVFLLGTSMGFVLFLFLNTKIEIMHPEWSLSLKKLQYSLL